MRIKKNFSLRTLLLGLTLLALVLGGLMQPFHVHAREQIALNELPVQARILDEYTLELT